MGDETVLLTGATGFIGRHCIPYLIDKGYEVHGVYSSESRHIHKYNENRLDQNINYHKCNLLDAIEQKNLIEKIKPTYCLHFAWYTEHGKYWNSNENFKWVQSGLNLVRNLVENGCKKIVMAGTYAELEESGIDGSLYCTCKDCLNQMCFQYVKEINKNVDSKDDVDRKKKKISYVWGRIFWAYGPYENPKRLIPYVINSLLNNECITINEGNRSTDFTYVKDVASAFVSMLDSGFENDIEGDVNITSCQQVSIKDVVYKIADKLNKNRNLVKFIESNNKYENECVFEDKLKKIGFDFKYSLDKGLDETIDWWKGKVIN